MRKKKVDSQWSIVDGGRRCASTTHYPLSTIHSPRRRGFSLTEILIVIALIVLILAMSMPAFNFITGSRSADTAMNQISAMLARARTEAVGLQEIRGVMFYLDPKTDREMMVLVQPTDPKTTLVAPNLTVDQQTNSAVEVWFTLESNTDHLALPRGIGIQVANDASNTTAGNYDRYVGFNYLPKQTPSSTDPIFGGVILFDAYGRLANVHYGFRMTDAAISTGVPNLMGQFAFPAEITANSAYQPVDQTIITTPSNNVAPLSSFGFVLFDRGTAEDKFGTSFNQDLSFISNTTISGPEFSEEQWLDDNSTAVLINRYNGTLVKGE